MKNGSDLKPLGDLCDFQRGLTYSKKDETDQPGTTVLRATNIDLATNLLDLSDLRFIKDSVPVPASKRIKPQGLLICTASGSKSHLGKVAYIDVETDYAFGGFMGMLTPKPDVLPRYLFHAMTAPNYKAFIGSLTDGANINNLRFDSLAQFPVPVPPLAEQRRIVAILDEAFEGIAAAKANAEKNLRNAREVFEAHLAAQFNDRSGNWPTANLEDVCGFQGGSQPPKSQFRFQPAKGFVRLLQIRDFASDKNLTYIPESKKNRLCESDDIMLGRYGASVGKVLTGLAGAYNVALIKTIPDESRITKRYLYHYLTSPAFQSPLRQVAARSAQDGFSREDIGGFQLALPPVAKQSAAVEMLDEVETECDRLGEQYSTASACFDELKASLLHQAFTGQL